MTLESLKDAYIHLSEAERAAFVSFVMSDYRPDEYIFTAEDIAEFERRAEEIKSGKVIPISAEEMDQYFKDHYGITL